MQLQRTPRSFRDRLEHLQHVFDLMGFAMPARHRNAAPADLAKGGRRHLLGIAAMLGGAGGDDLGLMARDRPVVVKGPSWVPRRVGRRIERQSLLRLVRNSRT